MTRLTAILTLLGATLICGGARDAVAQYRLPTPATPDRSSATAPFLPENRSVSSQPTTWGSTYATGDRNAARYAVLPRLRPDHAPYAFPHQRLPQAMPYAVPDCQSCGPRHPACPRCSRPCPSPAVEYRPPCDVRDLPCQPDDACVLKRLPPVEDVPSSYAPGGVNAFINVFSAAVARGVENATIRAFNSTQVCPSYQHCPPCECLPCQQQTHANGHAGNGSRQASPPCGQLPEGYRHQPIPAASAAGRRPVCATEFPVVFWDGASRAYLTLDAQGRRRKFDPEKHPELRVRLNLVNGLTTVEDEQARVHVFDPRTIPPHGLWWNTRSRRQEADGTDGKITAFDPRTPEFRDLVERFDLELDASSQNTIVTHKQSGTRFMFAPLP